MCYSSLATITDYDVWSPEVVDIATIIKVMEENVGKVQRLIAAVLPLIPAERTACVCPHTLKDAGI
jgi:5'-methylthioadenosine phosphorylase